MTPIPQYEIAVKRDPDKNEMCFRFSHDQDTFIIRAPKQPTVQETVNYIGDALRVEARRIALAEVNAHDKSESQIEERMEEVAVALYEQLCNTRFPK